MQLHRLSIACLGLALSFACCVDPAAAAPRKTPPQGVLRVYVGTYTRDGTSKGIYRMHLDTATGKLDDPVLVAETANPSFVAIHPNRRFLYAVGEMSANAGAEGGAVSAFAIDRDTGDLTALNQKPSNGQGPCHLTVDPSGRNVLVANYGSGSVACLPVGEDGALAGATSKFVHKGSSTNPQRQKGPHAHGIYCDGAGRYVFVPDLGLDKVIIYKLDAEAGKLAPNDPPFAAVEPGSGPRHLAFSPDGKFAYLINEMASTVTVFRYDSRTGALESIQTISTLPEFFTGKNTTAEIVVHPSGKYVYGSNRGHDSIAIFTVDPETGKLKLIGHEPTQGKAPRNFNLDPSGTWLLAANQDSDNVVAFRVDLRTGRLVPTGQSVSIGSPVCIEFTRP